jgi:hypothetical protein
MSTYKILVLTAHLSSVMINQAGADEACLAYAQSEMNRLLEVARDCGASPELIQSIKGPALSVASVQRAECRRRAETLTEPECPLVPICAALALEYAIENIDRFNGDCTSATEAGLQYVLGQE